MATMHKHTAEPPKTLSELPLSLTVSETAKILRVAPSTVYAQCKAGKVRSVSIGRVLRIPRAEIERHLGQS